MANYKECKICRDEQKRKHRFDIVWKIVAIVSTIIAVVFIVLYFAEGTVYEEMEIQNEVEIENSGDGSSYNSDIGNIRMGESNSNLSIIVGGIIAVLALVGGIIYGCYALSKNSDKKQSDREEQKIRDGREFDEDNR